MPKTAAVPGTFKVQGKRDGTYVLAGVRQDGSRVRFKVGSLIEGHTLARSIFQGAPAQPTGVVTPPASPNAAVDDFGLPVDYKLPVVTPETVRVGAPPPGAGGPGPNPNAIPVGSILGKTERTRNAESLCEMIGLGAAFGVGTLSNKFIEAYEDPPKPSKKHLNDLANNVRDGLKQSFGDREVGPWTMAILLAMGIPISMWLQAGPRKKKPEPAATAEPLRSVP